MEPLNCLVVFFAYSPIHVIIQCRIKGLKFQFYFYELTIANSFYFNFSIYYTQMKENFIRVQIDQQGLQTFLENQQGVMASILYRLSKLQQSQKEQKEISLKLSTQQKQLEMKISAQLQDNNEFLKVNTQQKEALLKLAADAILKQETLDEDAVQPIIEEIQNPKYVLKQQFSEIVHNQRAQTANADKRIQLVMKELLEQNELSGKLYDKVTGMSIEMSSIMENIKKLKKQATAVSNPPIQKSLQAFERGKEKEISIPDFNFQLLISRNEQMEQLMDKKIVDIDHKLDQYKQILGYLQKETIRKFNRFDQLEKDIKDLFKFEKMMETVQVKQRTFDNRIQECERSLQKNSEQIQNLDFQRLQNQQKTLYQQAMKTILLIQTKMEDFVLRSVHQQKLARLERLLNQSMIGIENKADWYQVRNYFKAFQAELREILKYLTNDQSKAVVTRTNCLSCEKIVHPIMRAGTAKLPSIKAREKMHISMHISK